MLTNLRKYGQFVPPEYPLARITVPVIFYHSLNDFLATHIIPGCENIEGEIAECSGGLYVKRTKSFRLCIRPAYTGICLRSSNRKNEFHFVRGNQFHLENHFMKKEIDNKISPCFFISHAKCELVSICC